jgi:transcriptional regulator with XRE-family HTH domain
MSEFDSMTFARRLKALREERGLNQKELSRAAGLTEAAIANYEVGRGMPNAVKVVALADALGCTTDVLLGIVPLAVA